MRLHKTKFYSFFLLFMACASSGFAQTKEIALTLDDLPFVGEAKNFHLNMIIDTLKASEVPATGFVIASEVQKNNWEVLHRFREAGFGLGNHTLSHANLNQLNADSYIREIDTADHLLTSVLTQPKYFRYPYLASGTGNKKEQVTNYLLSKHYRVAPVTIDSKDFVFNQLLLSVPESERRHFLTILKPCYLDFIWQQTRQAEEHSRAAHKPDEVQILLLHANLLSAYTLSDIIHLYQEHGYRFVSLGDALASAAERHSLSDMNLQNITHENEAYVEWD